MLYVEAIIGRLLGSRRGASGLRSPTTAVTFACRRDTVPAALAPDGAHERARRLGSVTNTGISAASIVACARRSSFDSAAKRHPWDSVVGRPRLSIIECHIAVEFDLTCTISCCASFTLSLPAVIAARPAACATMRAGDL